MKIQEVIDIARYSELNSVAVKDNIDAIIAFLNLGLSELYTRFPIKVKEHIVPLVADVVTYSLPYDYMYALSAYIEPPEDSINQDLIEIAINDGSKEQVVYFPDWRTIQVPADLETTYVAVIYVAKPEKVSATNTELELDLPDTLVDALVSYIGYRAHLGVRGDGQAENNAHWQRFERNCQKARELGVAYQLDALDMTKKVEDRGFV